MLVLTAVEWGLPPAGCGAEKQCREKYLAQTVFVRLRGLEATVLSLPTFPDSLEFGLMDLLSMARGDDIARTEQNPQNQPAHPAVAGPRAGC